MNGWSWWWLSWFTATIASFLVPELYALSTGHGENTLSAQVWKLEKIAPGQHVWEWTALHVLIGGLLAVVLIWLLVHLVFGIWR
jgi:hypothetical protein